MTSILGDHGRGLEDVVGCRGAQRWAPSSCPLGPQRHEAALGLPKRALCRCLGVYKGQLVVLGVYKGQLVVAGPLQLPGSALLNTWLQAVPPLCLGLLVGRPSRLGWHESSSVQTARGSTELRRTTVRSGNCGFSTSGGKVNTGP